MRWKQDEPVNHPRLKAGSLASLADLARRHHLKYCIFHKLCMFLFQQTTTKNKDEPKDNLKQVSFLELVWVAPDRKVSRLGSVPVKLKVNTKGDARFEGTNLESGGDASVKAGGDVKFDAARNEESRSSGSENVSASISAS